MEKKQKAARGILTVAAGAAIGLTSGLFGGGGGMLCVPLLERVLKEETKVAHATAILVILPITAASAVMYIINGFFELTPVLSAGAGVVAGGVCGALLLKKLPAKLVAFIFSLLMIAAGVVMVLRK
ncbi:MAG: TSUP family transporter [Firmicutes bacterium]|nr:TSUP family transporter [Bacillota bacterium]